MNLVSFVSLCWFYIVSSLQSRSTRVRMRICNNISNKQQNATVWVCHSSAQQHAYPRHRKKTIETILYMSLRHTDSYRPMMCIDDKKETESRNKYDYVHVCKYNEPPILSKVNRNTTPYDDHFGRSIISGLQSQIRKEKLFETLSRNVLSSFLPLSYRMLDHSIVCR